MPIATRRQALARPRSQQNELPLVEVASDDVPTQDAINEALIDQAMEDEELVEDEDEEVIGRIMLSL